jgi:hypothetical protein
LASKLVEYFDVLFNTSVAFFANHDLRVVGFLHMVFGQVFPLFAARAFPQPSHAKFWLNQSLKSIVTRRERERRTYLGTSRPLSKSIFLVFWRVVGKMTGTPISVNLLMLQITLSSTTMVGLDILSALTNPLTLEIIIGLATVVVGTLIADNYETRRNRPIIEFAPTTSGDRLGFFLSVKRKTLEHPRILFYAGNSRYSFGEKFQHCDLYDEDGNLYKDDFIIAGDRPVAIYPLLATRVLKTEGNRVSVTIRIIDAKSRRDFIEEFLPPLPKSGNYAFSFPKEPKPSNDHYAIIQISAQGLDREEIQRYRVGLSSLMSGLTGNPYDTESEATLLFHHELVIKKEPRLWILH